MSDQQQATQTNGEERPPQSPEELEIKAKHRQEIARIESEDRRAMAEMYRGMPVPLRVIFDPFMNERVQAAAMMMSRAEGFTPRHLIGKTEACFVVVTKALTWRQDPQAVAASTYQTPDGKVGYEGKLIQSIIESSGRLSRPIGQGEYFGDWSKVEGRFKIVKKRTQAGKEYDAAVPEWEYYGPDEEGLGVRYRVWLKDQNDPMPFEFKLRSAFPRNATTWPTRPQQQLHYAAMRALGNVVCPSLLMGVPFQDDLSPVEPEMRDITPKAPAPVDLEKEGVRGGGPMRDEPETSDARAPKGGGESTASAATSVERTESARAESEAPHGSGEQASQDQGEQQQTWTVAGKPYVKAGSAANQLIKMVGECDAEDRLDGFGDPDHELGSVVASLPDDHRDRVAEAVQDRRQEIAEASADRAGPAEQQAGPGDDDGEPLSLIPPA